MKLDPHHCHCFKILSLSDETIFEMEQEGFKEQIFEEDHGQIFSRTKRLNKCDQIHFKILQDWTAESEIEYPPDYPMAHLNSTHSYSAHKETKNILDYFGIPYKQKRITPITCIQRKIVKAIDPIHWTDLAALIIGVSVFVGVYAVSKTDTNQNRQTYL